MTTNIRPISDRVLIRRSKPEEVSKGGIVLPGNAQEKQIEGTVLAVGPGRHDDHGRIIEMTVRVGDRVLFEPYAGQGQAAKMTGALDENTLIVREGEILAVLES